MGFVRYWRKGKEVIMSIIGQISGNIYTAAYEPKSANAKESNAKKEEKLKDSVALSNRVSASSSDDKSIAVLKKMVIQLMTKSTR